MTDRRTTWLEIAVDLPAEMGEIMATVLQDVAEGVETRDAGTLLKAAAGRAVIVAYVAPESRDLALATIEVTVERAREAGLAVDGVAVTERTSHEDEWRDVWKQFFRATRVGRTFIVRPSWDPGTVCDGDRVIDLDPGRAFGTGGHATTRLVIRLAEELGEARARQGAPVRRFLDLGCGSGILSIAAARLWPDAAGTAVDVDSEATDCAQENLARNRVTTVMTATGTLDVLADAPPFDVVLANIQADVLGPLAPDVHARIVPGGHAILSGLLTKDTDAVAAAYLAAGFEPQAREEDDEWSGLTLRRR
ncbi:MAG TPA: 50S ribosomal protein L11 methyltransferase [Polyangia bacterium]